MTYFVFTDEAGSYTKQPSESFRRSHPFYIRSSVRLSADDYRLFQNELQELNKDYPIPIGEEIKWSDLWEIGKGKYRESFLRFITPDQLKGYYRKVFEHAAAKESLQFIFTITFLYIQHAYHSEPEILKFHLQEAMQRVQMDTKPDGFATFIMDELNQEKVRQLKAACHRLTVEGDFVKYKNVYHGVLTESSALSGGIQLADFSAGVVNGYLRGALLSRGQYTFATDLYRDYIAPRLRHHSQGRIIGYGIREVPKSQEIRSLLIPLFKQTGDIAKGTTPALIETLEETIHTE